MTKHPWASGPSEILQHGLSLLKKDSDTNRRLALLSIDNSVELAIKTYLSLPRRATNIRLSRKEYLEISESFPRLLDALEQYAAEKLEGIDLSDIEWFHRLRNELYHQGNGLTVEKDKVEIYAELAKILFRNLFEFDVEITGQNESADLLGSFLVAWVDIERAFSEIVEKNPTMFKHSRGPLGNLFIVDELVNNRLIKANTADRINEIREIRNKVVHGVENFRDLITPELIIETKSIAEQLKNPYIPPPYQDEEYDNDNSEDEPF